MNPIPLNDRGQFRYADFMAYMPEFLREEPDVVELVQVMSDYINDAYRNIEDVEEFEFKLCVAEAKLGRATERLGTLREMFNLASGRSERVSYLSVPRANVKSNEVFGKATGRVPYYVDVPYDTVRDEIDGLGRLDPGIVGSLSDGDVVFARYVNADPVVTRAYYYSRATGTLVADPEGTSQDPFTDTYNTGSRCISFLVDDISSVNSRFGYMDSAGNSYYEVFFTARVSDVRSDPATEKVRFDVDRVEPGEEGLVVDYYGMSTARDTEYRTTMGFYGEDGWSWKSGYPAGMFYLKETSGAKLSAAAGVSGKELLADPASAMEASKYAIVSVEPEGDSGLYRFVTDSALPQTDGARFYLVSRKRRDGGQLVGEFLAMPSSSVSGEYATRMRKIRLDEEPADWTDYFLVDFPLFYDKGVPDFTASRPLMSWTVTGGDAGLDWSSATVCRCSPRDIYGAGVEPYEVAAVDFDPDDHIESPLGMNQFLVPYAVKASLKPGMRLYSNGMLWDGINPVKSVEGAVYNDGTVTGAIVTMVNGLNKGSALSGVPLVTGFETMLGYLEEGLYTCMSYLPSTIVFDGSDASATKGFLLCRGEDGSEYSVRVTWVGALAGHGLCLKVEPGVLPAGEDFAAAVFRVECDKGSVKGFDDIRRTGTSGFSATCRSVSGDVYTDSRYFAYDSRGNFAMLSADTANDVLPLEAGRRYRAGDVVYDPQAGMPYRCAGDCTLSDGEVPSRSPYFRVDRLTGSTSPYAKVYNAFIPYYGPVKALDFGGKVEYSAGTALATMPLYITKVNENRLKYGWEHREFLNYGTAVDMTGRERNGSVDVFSSARSDGSGFESANDIVTATLDSKTAWAIDYPLVLRGTDDYLPVDIDGDYVTAEDAGDSWRVSVRSAGHGLVEGCTVRVTGLGGNGDPTLDGYWQAGVPDGDSVVFLAAKKESERGMHGTYEVEPVPGTTPIEYVGMYMAAVTGISPVSGEASMVDAVLRVADPRGFSAGKAITLVDRDAVKEYAVDVESVSTDSASGVTTVRVSSANAGDILGASGHSFHFQESASEGDYVRVGGSLYLVKKTAWEEKERYDLAVPCRVYSRQNLVDTSDTNPEFAMGDEIDVEDIRVSGEGLARVHTRGMLPHFTAENSGVISGRTMVYITGAVPACYNGWHTVMSVASPKSFEIGVCYRGGEAVDAVGMNGGTITLREGRWYSYGVGGIDWDKVGNRVTYSLSNTIRSVDGKKVITGKEHGLSAGDLVVVGDYDAIVSVDAYSPAAVKGSIDCYRVSSVDGKYGLYLESLDGGDVEIDDGECIARGVAVSDPADSIGSLRDEYTMKLASVGGNYCFRNGDIVVALAQENPSEVKAWKVVSGAYWEPVRKKRSLKVSILDVESYRNGEFDGTDVESGEAYEKYATYSDVDVAAMDDAYVAGFRCAKNARFSNPALADMDTTRTAEAEYSSAEDFSTVSPRHGMKPSFRGVPGMKYPLVEKIERLCYLRDASVIDYDFIGYLARFLGYDITPMGDDVAESPLYRTKRERELAVRETVANLPQYYALGGTKAGLHMLFSTFGVISEALTLWTDADDPYKEMITRDEVVERVESGEGGSWVPTPYIDIAITNDAKYPQFAVRQSDIARLKEQIRVFKPINVVFRDFLLRLEDTVLLDPRISIAGIRGSTFMGALTARDAGPEPEYVPETVGGCR